jgi:flagellar biosynthesis protein FlhG
MHDQAQTLRKLVRECVRADAAPAVPRPAVLVVVGAQQGVGTTSVAQHLTAAFQQLGQASILVDAGATEGIALQAQAEGIQIFAASADNRLAAADANHHRWIAELAHVAPGTEVVVVDGGNGSRTGMQAIWEASTVALLVTSPDPPSVLRVYTRLKLLHTGGPRPWIYCLVNRAPDAATAGAVFARLHQACRRFLDLDLRPAGFVPQEPSLTRDERRHAPQPLVQLAQPVRERLIRAASALCEGLHGVDAKFPVISCQERFNLEPRSDRYTRTLSVADQPINFAD